MHSFCEITLNPRPAPSDPQATPADSSSDAEMQVNQSMRQKKRKNLGQLTQMWVDGVRWSQTIVHHLSYGIFDPFFPPENAIFFLRTVKTVGMVDMVDIWLKLSA